MEREGTQEVSAQREALQGARRWRQTLLWMGLFLSIGIVISVFLDSRTGIVRYVPVAWIHVIKAVWVLIIGAIISQILERRLFNLSIDKLGPQRSTIVRYLTRLLLFIVITVSILTAFGVGVPSVIFGGTFLTVIIGLAGQTIFSNIIGGIWLIFVRPFRIGDFIGIIAWQFPLLMPSFPHEATRPTYYGHVIDINLMYTKIMNREGYPQLIPNGIIAQSFIENRSHEGAHRVRLRFDVSYEVDSSAFIREFRRRLEAEFLENGGLAPEVTFADIYPTAYSIAACVYSAEREELVRDRVLALAVGIIQELRQTSGEKLEQNGASL